jgi:hypothetical protein
MTPLSTLALRTQSASEALAIWERASHEDRPVGVDKQGNLTLIYGAWSNTFSGTSSDRIAAKHAVLAKMRSEASQGGSWNANMLQTRMQAWLPSLESFLAADDLGNLRAEWTSFTANACGSLQLPEPVYAQRKAVADRAAPFLPPGLGISLHDNGMSWLTHTFSDTEQAQIVNRLTQLSDTPIDPELHLAQQTLADLARGLYDIDVSERQLATIAAKDSKNFLMTLDRRKDLSAKARETIYRLHAFCDGDLQVMSSVSKLLNQYAISAVIKADENELRPASGEKATIHANSKRLNTNSIFTLRRADNDALLLSLCYLKKGSSLNDSDGRLLCRFMADANAEVCSEDHFNFRCHADFRLSVPALRTGEILPDPTRPAAVDYVMDVQW